MQRGSFVVLTGAVLQLSYTGLRFLCMCCLMALDGGSSNEYSKNCGIAALNSLVLAQT